jgi:hypothetical protein
MQVYIYDSRDGDVQAFSTFEKAWAYAQDHGWTTNERAEDDWLLGDATNDQGDIFLVEIDNPK